MLKSKVEFKNSKPYININGKLHSPLAYTTYFEERGEWSDFIKNGKKAIELYKEKSIPFIECTEEKPFFHTDELRDLLIDSGVHCYNADGAVFYCGTGFIGIHTVADGETKITLPRSHKIRPLFENEESEFETDTIIVDLPKHSTKIYEIL